MTGDSELDELRRQLERLESRVATLEARSSGERSGRAPRAGASSGADPLDAGEWTEPYRAAELEVSETWIELHEHSARPQLQRLIRAVVEVEGPVTERLVLDRVRRAWGLRRAGGRVQEAFDQAVRQLLARGLVERDGDALQAPGAQLRAVRVPGGDEASRRAAEDVPLVELAMAIERAATQRPGREDELTMGVAKLFGWTRRGGSIQERLDSALELAEQRGMIVRELGDVRPA